MPPFPVDYALIKFDLGFHDRFDNAMISNANETRANHATSSVLASAEPPDFNSLPRHQLAKPGIG